MEGQRRGEGNRLTGLTAQEARQLARDRLEEVYVPLVIKKREYGKDGRKIMQRYRNRRNRGGSSRGRPSWEYQGVGGICGKSESKG